jgi:hypothetical protein
MNPVASTTSRAGPQRQKKHRADCTTSRTSRTKLKKKTDHSPKKTTQQEEPEKVEPVKKERESRTQEQCVYVCVSD